WNRLERASWNCSRREQYNGYPFFFPWTYPDYEYIFRYVDYIFGEKKSDVHLGMAHGTFIYPYRRVFYLSHFWPFHEYTNKMFLRQKEQGRGAENGGTAAPGQRGRAF